MTLDEARATVRTLLATLADAPEERADVVRAIMAYANTKYPDSVVDAILGRKSTPKLSWAIVTFARAYKKFEAGRDRSRAAATRALAEKTGN